MVLRFCLEKPAKNGMAVCPGTGIGMDNDNNGMNCHAYKQSYGFAICLENPAMMVVFNFYMDMKTELRNAWVRSGVLEYIVDNSTSISVHFSANCVFSRQFKRERKYI